MTTTASGRKATSACNGVTTEFAVPFELGASSDLLVYLLDDADADNDDGALLSEGSDYTVSGDMAAGTGAITTLTTYATGNFIRRWRETSRAQDAAYVANDGFAASAHEAALDRLAMVDEEQGDDIARLDGRAVQVPAGVTAPPLDLSLFEGKAIGVSADSSEFVPLTLTDDGTGVDVLETLAEEGDALNAYVAAGSAPAVQTVREKLRRQPVNLMDYIARTEWAAIEAGTSTFNATTALTNAAALGKRIIVSAGATIRLNYTGIASGFELEGECRKTSILRPYDKAGHLLLADSGAAGTFIQNIRIANLTLKGWLDGGSFPFLEQCHLIFLNGVDGFMVEDCDLIGARGDMICLGSGLNDPSATERHNKGGTIRFSFFDGLLKDNRNAISVIDCDGLNIVANRITRCTRSNQPGPIDIEPDANAWHVVKGIKVLFNEIWDCGGNVGQIAMVILAVVTAPTRILIAHNNISAIDLTSSPAAIAYTGLRAPSATAAFTDLRIEGNRLANGGTPISFGGLRGASVVGNHLESFTGSVVLGFSDPATEFGRDISFDDNTLVQVGTSGCAVLVSSSATISIRRNHFDRCGIDTAAGGLILLHAGEESDGIAIENNSAIFRASQTKAVLLGAAHTQAPSKNSYRGNRFAGKINEMAAANQAGRATLVAGVATVTTAGVAADSNIIVQRQTDGGTIGCSYSITRTAGTSFTITSRKSDGTTETADTSIVAWQMEPAA